MHRIAAPERRARLGQRHRLAPGSAAGSPSEVAESLVAVHSTDPASVYLGILSRMADGSLSSVEQALYTDRTLVRLLGMRRTVFVTTREIAALIQAACGHAVAARERRKVLGYLSDSGVGPDPDAWLAEVEEVVLQALAARGEATAAEITADDPRLQTELVLSRGKSYEGRQAVGSRVLFLLAAQGRVVRGRPRGSWTSQQYRWLPMAQWCPDGLDEWATEAAEAELARRWLSRYGPATPEDLQWWTGWTRTQTRRALTAIAPVDVDLDGQPGIVLADDLAPVPAAEPWLALLPGLDSTPMGWQRRDWFLGEHASRVFDRNGNVGPTVWWDGRIVGGWAQNPDGQVVCRFLEDAGSEAVAAAEKAAARLTAVVGPVKLGARARGLTWLEQELAGR
jgi:hypothetical protein